MEDYETGSNYTGRLHFSLFALSVVRIHRTSTFIYQIVSELLQLIKVHILLSYFKHPLTYTIFFLLYILLIIFYTLKAGAISCCSALLNPIFVAVASQLLTLTITLLLICRASSSLNWKKSITSIAKS